MPSGQRILVTGAGGFIASHVIEQLVTSGCSVVGLERDVDGDRQRHNVADMRRAGIDLTLMSGDMLDVDLVGLLRDVDGVVHLAGSPGVASSWANGFDHHVDNNVVATQRLFEAALDAPATRIVVASSSSVYGSVSSGRATERQTLRPLSPYGASKAAMEMLVGAYNERGLSIVPLRYFTVFGPRQRPDMAMHRIIHAAMTGSPFPLRGDGTQERSFTFVEDVARATVSALDATTTDPINIGGGVSTSLTQVIDVVEAITGTTVPVEPAPDMPGDPLRTAADTTRAHALLGWDPRVDLRTGLERQVEWQSGLSISPSTRSAAT